MRLSDINWEKNRTNWTADLDLQTMTLKLTYRPSDKTGSVLALDDDSGEIVGMESGPWEDLDKFIRDMKDEDEVSKLTKREDDDLIDLELDSY